MEHDLCTVVSVTRGYVRATVPENGDIRTIDTTSCEVSHCARRRFLNAAVFHELSNRGAPLRDRGAANFEGSRVAKSALAEFATSSVRVLFAIVGLRRR
jgi:hypothetical protein